MSESAAPASKAKTALILTGGGARAAYQVGVLLAIAKLSHKRRHNPFPILCGTSAGAINAAGLACMADNYGKGVGILASIWRNMQAGDIYRADAIGVGASGARWLSALALGWLIGNPGWMAFRLLDAKLAQPLDGGGADPLRAKPAVMVMPDQLEAVPLPG